MKKMPSCLTFMISEYSTNACVSKHGLYSLRVQMAYMKSAETTQWRVHRSVGVFFFIIIVHLTDTLSSSCPLSSFFAGVVMMMTGYLLYSFSFKKNSEVYCTLASIPY